MSATLRYRNLSLRQLLLAYLFASWHVRRMPGDTAEQRLQRATWCRDHCTTFSERWYGLGALAWFVQISPLGVLFTPAEVPLLGLFFLVAFGIGTRHLIWQVTAQEKAGLPPIDEPVSLRDERRPPARKPRRRR